MTETVVLDRLEMTCGACPSQWDAWDAEGIRYYIRYRWGYLSVVKDGICGPPWDQGRPIYGEQLGGEYDGVMTTEEMLNATGLELGE